MNAVWPIELRQLGPSSLGVVWSDGHSSLYPTRRIRLACRCANCIDEWSHENKIDETLVPQDVRPRNIETVGRYAFRIDWTDGHSTGIYPFDALRKLCECPACRKASA